MGMSKSCLIFPKRLLDNCDMLRILLIKAKRGENSTAFLLLKEYKPYWVTSVFMNLSPTVVALHFKIKV